MRRRRGLDTLAFMRRVRLCYPRRIRLYWIQDNLSANWTPDIRKFAADNNIELVPLPTYASYLNRIEAHARPITEFVVNNTDYLDWESFQHALAAHVRHRNGADRDRRVAERERRLMVAA
jgi:transposase